MPRVKRGTKKRKRRAKTLKLAKGYWGARSTNYRTAKEAVEKAHSVHHGILCQKNGSQGTARKTDLRRETGADEALGLPVNWKTL